MIKNTKITILAINLVLLYTDNAQSAFHDDFEKEMIEKVDLIEQQLETTKKNTESSLKDFHNHFFQDIDTRTNNFPNYASQQNISNNQTTRNFYQQSSNSLSFANNDKAIKVIEQKDNNFTTYTITVTNKVHDKSRTATTIYQKSDIQTELQELESYIKKNFHSNPAHKILEECMHVMAEEHKDRLINIASSTNNNEKKYTIEIAHKKENLIDTTPTKKSRKKKKIKKNHN